MGPVINNGLVLGERGWEIDDASTWGVRGDTYVFAYQGGSVSVAVAVVTVAVYSTALGCYCGGSSEDEEDGAEIELHVGVGRDMRECVELMTRSWMGWLYTLYIPISTPDLGDLC